MGKEGERGKEAMIVEAIRAELANQRSRPKGMRITLETYREMEEKGLIERKDFGILGVLKLGSDLPFFEGDIFLLIDPELEVRGLQFEIPVC